MLPLISFFKISYKDNTARKLKFDVMGVPECNFRGIPVAPKSSDQTNKIAKHLLYAAYYHHRQDFLSHEKWMLKQDGDYVTWFISGK